MTITTKTGEAKSPTVILKEYFGLQASQTISQFADELKALTPEAKEELIRGAAIALGYSVADDTPASAIEHPAEPSAPTTPRPSPHERN